MHKFIIYSVLLGSLMACSRKPSDPGIEFAPQMYHAIPIEPYSQIDYNKFYNDKKNAQAPVAGTVARNKEDHFYPFPNNADGYEEAGKKWFNPHIVDEKFIAEGKRLFEINCSHCHGMQGGNDGPVMASGKFPKPGWPNYQSEYIRTLPIGKIYHTLTYGKNLMGSHATQLDPKQRWMVAEYVKVLSKIGMEEKKEKADTTKTENKPEQKQK